MQLALGIDIGTSGCRGIVIDPDGTTLADAAVSMPSPRQDGTHSEQAPGVWWQAVIEVLTAIACQVDPGRIGALAVDGTSGTLLLTDADGLPLGPALMYNDTRSQQEAARIGDLAPPDSAARGAGSALARLLYLERQPAARDAIHALHQADWIAGTLCARFDFSDENNCLKLGYDPVMREWPDWLQQLGIDPALLPDVVPPGTEVGRLCHDAILALGYRSDLKVIAGTTDGVAAFLATGADTPGDAVTSLGSTLVLKLLGTRPINSARYGIYSHRLGDLWLCGGASNSGGAVLLEHFTIEEIEALSTRIDATQASGLEYYPLRSPGERFPHADPALAPRLTPRPGDDALFLQGLFEGIAAIEALGYRRLVELGAPALRRVYSVGGGARNLAWTRIRRQRLGVPFEAPRSEHACFGVALLAGRAIHTDQNE